ncbi:hypothetical protein FBEOM_4272 [Fusarium beomiforme]|uniref:Uncharacterized protein n=1 Tax=Fusarium beomiforme TaxID=44412 RepID=A0A9P5E031_9HYPO|nr:hypothetical protein FBEOM_4272 [Fusarium beomiforme]
MKLWIIQLLAIISLAPCLISAQNSTLSSQISPSARLNLPSSSEAKTTASSSRISASAGSSDQVSNRPSTTISRTSLPSTISTTTSAASATTPAPTNTEVTAYLRTYSWSSPVEPTTTMWKMDVHNLQCNHEEDYPGHAEIQQFSVMGVIEWICRDAYEGRWWLEYGKKPYVKEYFDNNTNKHRLTWSWLPQCKMKEDVYWFMNPVPGLRWVWHKQQCRFILSDAWINCDNGGVGGSYDVGCLRYRLESGI